MTTIGELFEFVFSDVMSCCVRASTLTTEKRQNDIKVLMEDTLILAHASARAHATGLKQRASFSPINKPLLFRSAPINNIPGFCGSLNKKDVGCLPDLFSRSGHRSGNRTRSVEL